MLPNPQSTDARAAFADGELTTCSESSGAELIERLRARVGLKIEAAMAAIETVEEYHDEAGTRRGGRDSAIAAQSFYKRWAMAIKSFKGPRAFAFDCGLLALGWTGILGCSDQVALARKWKCTKQNVEKAVGMIQKLCDAPPTPQQRSAESCKRMSNVRKTQLKK